MPSTTRPKSSQPEADEALRRYRHRGSPPRTSGPLPGRGPSTSVVLNGPAPTLWNRSPRHRPRTRSAIAPAASTSAPISSPSPRRDDPGIDLVHHRDPRRRGAGFFPTSARSQHGLRFRLHHQAPAALGVGPGPGPRRVIRENRRHESSWAHRDEPARLQAPRRGAPPSPTPFPATSPEPERTHAPHPCPHPPPSPRASSSSMMTPIVADSLADFLRTQGHRPSTRARRRAARPLAPRRSRPPLPRMGRPAGGADPFARGDLRPSRSPRMNGIELSSAGSPRNHPGVAVIMLTAYGTIEFRRAGPAAGARATT